MVVESCNKKVLKDIKLFSDYVVILQIHQSLQYSRTPVCSAIRKLQGSLLFSIDSQSHSFSFVPLIGYISCWVTLTAEDNDFVTQKDLGKLCLINSVLSINCPNGSFQFQWTVFFFNYLLKINSLKNVLYTTCNWNVCHCSISNKWTYVQYLKR